MPTVYDKSEFQQPGAGPFGDGAEILRAGNGRRKDYKVDEHVAAARAHGLIPSMYLYCEPASTSPEWQAELLVSVAIGNGVSHGTTLYADIEEGSGDLRWFEDRFIGRVNQLGFVCDTYSGDYFFGAHNIVGRGKQWKAAYGPNDGRMHTPPHQPYLMWQFTSVPLDTSDLTEAAKQAIFAGQVAAPKPKWFEEEEAA